MNDKEKITLNALYQRLSKYAKHHYPAPFQNVNNIDDYVKIAFEQYMNPMEHSYMADL